MSACKDRVFIYSSNALLMHFDSDDIDRTRVTGSIVALSNQRFALFEFPSVRTVSLTLLCSSPLHQKQADLRYLHLALIEAVGSTWPRSGFDA